MATALLLASAGNAATAPLGGWVRTAPADESGNRRILVKWREQGVAAIRIDSLAARTARLVNSTGQPLKAMRSFGPRIDVVELSNSAGIDAQREELGATLARLRADPSVETAEVDSRIYISAIPTDPRYSAGSDANGSWRGQWYLDTPSLNTPAAIGATTAWESSRGTGVTIAILDTGILPHPDLASPLPGYDFVCHDGGSNTSACSGAGTSFLIAGDNSSWDGDPTDPGDYISAPDLALPNSYFLANACGSGDNHDQPLDSSWHGTRVAGLIGATMNNGIGIAGVANASRLLPVRVIGKCSGYTSDLIAALYWVAGISDASLGSVALPPTANQAQIINLSLGNRQDCSTLEQSAIDAVIAKGILIVAAAGNEGGPLGSPGNCRGVLAVAGLRQVGTKVGYSNVSSTAASIGIAAPAGNCINTAPNTECVYALNTLSNDGKQTAATSGYTYSLLNPGYTGNNLNGFNIGTSFAAPLVTAVAALMKSANPGLSPTQLIARIQQSAAPFPVPATPATGGICHVAALTRDANNVYNDIQDRDCQCTTATCGAGMLNANAAVMATLRPGAVITPSSTTGSLGQRIQLDGSASRAAANRVIVSYAWSSDEGVEIANATSAVAQFIFPALRPVTIRLTVTDDSGLRDSVAVTIDSTLVAALGGGGGGLDPISLSLLLLTLTLVLAGRRRIRN
jgi:serine protease